MEEIGSFTKTSLKEFCDEFGTPVSHRTIRRLLEILQMFGVLSKTIVPTNLLPAEIYYFPGHPFSELRHSQLREEYRTRFEMLPETIRKSRKKSKTPEEIKEEMKEKWKAQKEAAEELRKESEPAPTPIPKPDLSTLSEDRLNTRARMVVRTLEKTGFTVSPDDVFTILRASPDLTVAECVDVLLERVPSGTGSGTGGE